MVGKKLFRDAFREIRRSILRFIAMLAIVALGTAFFVGVRMSSPDMKLAGGRYFTDSNFMDFTLLSTAGFTEDDVAAVRAQAGVLGVMPAYSADAVTEVNGGQKVLHILSLPPVGSNTDETDSADDINRPRLISGRFPENDGECVIEYNRFTGINYGLGDKIALASGTDADLLNTLTADSFTVVGIVDSPLYISKDRGTAPVGSGTVAAFMMIPASAFKIPANMDSPIYTALYVTDSDAKGKTAYSKEYDEAVAPLKSALDALAAQRAETRTQDLINTAKQAMIDQATAAAEAAQASQAQLSDESLTEAAAAAVKPVTWYVLTRSDNTGYKDYGDAADRVTRIAQVFPIIFILVAILVCLTSMSRMVEEQRTQMGVTKALGYGRGAVALKFLLYALLASAAGCAVGLAAGFLLFPYIITHAYAILYTVPYTVFAVSGPYVAGSLVAALAVTGFSALATCYRELNAPAAALMRPRAPKPGKRILIERVKPLWKRMTFTQKTTARNLFRYKSRSLMTVAGVALCTALLLVGFGLNDAVGGLGSAQFGGIDKYQCEIAVASGVSPDDRENLENYIENLQGYQSMQRVMFKPVTAGTVTESCYLSVPEDPADLPQYVSLRDKNTGAELSLSDGGAVISEKLASLLNARAGDYITLNIGPDGENVVVKVDGVCENYLYHYIYMSPARYQSLCGEAPAYNMIDVRLEPYDKAENQAMSAGIIQQPGAAQATFMTDRISLASDITRSIFSVVLVLIVSAALLSFIVLFTLTNINISERLREIATLRVLGFFRGEAARYVLRENIILTAIGTALGLLLGVPLTRYISSTAEVENIHFLQTIYPLSFVMSAALTLAFALLVDVCVRPRIRRINMVEALKTVE